MRERRFTWTDPAVTFAAVSDRPGIDSLRAMIDGELPRPPLAAALDFDLVAVEPGRAEFRFEPAEYHYNPIGSVHGGVYATLLDSAAGCAVQSMLTAGVRYTTLDLAVKFLRPLRTGSGPATCVGTVTHMGSRTALAEARLHTADGKLVATATSSCLILR